MFNMDSNNSASMERNRNIVYSKLMMKKDDSKEFAQQMLVARYGLPPASEEDVPLCAEIGVFKGNHNHKKLSQCPLYTIPLKDAKTEDGSTTMEESKTKKSLSKHSFQFCLATSDGHSYKFRLRDAREHRTWTNLIKFLSMFPHSVVPELPVYEFPAANDIKFLRSKGSSWPVYIMPEEVGLRCQLEGPKILVLEKQNETNKLEVYGNDESCPLQFSCMHSEIRRIGKMGIFLYVEVGRRCRAGPGLLWLFFGNNNDKAMEMREILCRFLLNKEPPRFLLNKEPPQYQPELSDQPVTRMTRSFTAPLLSEAFDLPPPPRPPPSSPPPPLPPIDSMPATAPMMPPLVPDTPPPIPTSPRPMGPSTSPFTMTRYSLSSQGQPASPLATSVEFDKKYNRPNSALVGDKPTKQSHLCNSYHTLEQPLQDRASSRSPQYHVLEQPDSSSPSSSSQTTLYHVLEQEAERKLTGRDSLRKGKMTFPYLVTDLQSRCDSTSPEFQDGSRSVTTAEAGMERNTYHVLEAPPAGKCDKQRTLESSRSQSSLSEKPLRHKLNSSQLHTSYSQLEASASKGSPRLRFYHGVGRSAKKPAGNGLSQSLELRSDRNTCGPSIGSQDTARRASLPRYHILEVGGEENRQPPLQHHYDAVNTRRRASSEKTRQQEDYSLLGAPHSVTSNSSQAPVYQTLGQK